MHHPDPQQIAHTASVDRLNLLEQGHRPVDVLQPGPRFVCLILPHAMCAQTYRPANAQAFKLAASHLRQSTPGELALDVSPAGLWPTFVGPVDLLDPEARRTAYVHCAPAGPLEFVIGSSSFCNHRPDQPFVIVGPNGYQRPLNERGLPQIRAALKELALTGRATVTLGLLRLTNTEVAVEDPAPNRKSVKSQTVLVQFDLDGVDDFTPQKFAAPLNELWSKLVDACQ
ncbi:hypothetical protein QZM28_19800 [Burkholderia multivorans]|nr:hypothetical protein [Burkholderia multivorans]